MMRFILAASLALLLNPLAPVFATEIENVDEQSLELKGYSPELTYPVEVQISRMEGRYPPAPPSRGKQAWANFLNGEWAGNLQPFPQEGVTPPHFQAH